LINFGEFHFDSINHPVNPTVKIKSGLTLKVRPDFHYNRFNRLLIS